MKKFNLVLLSLVLAVSLIGGCSLSQDESQRYAYLDKQEMTPAPQLSFDEEDIPASPQDLTTQIVGLWRLETVTIDDDEENFKYYGSAYDIKADGIITHHYFFEPMYEQIDWSVDEHSIITLDSPSQSRQAQLTFETRDGKEYMIWDFADQISEYYRTSQDEFSVDKENATKNDAEYAAYLKDNVWTSQQHTLPSGDVDEANEYSMIFYPDSTFKRIGYPYYGQWEVTCSMLNLYYDDTNMGSLNLPIEITETGEGLGLKLYGTLRENEDEHWQYVSSEQPKFSAEDLVGFWHAVFVNNVEIIDDGQAYEFKDDGTIIMYGSFEPYDTGLVKWELAENELIRFSFEDGESALKVTLLEHEEKSYLYFYNGDVEWIFARSTYEEFKDRLNSN